MNKLKNIWSAMLCLALLLAFTACDDEVEYTPADKLSNAQVYFSNENPDKIDLNADKSVFQVTIARLQTDDAVTVPLSLQGGEGKFQAPASVQFAQGENKKSIDITYDASKLEVNVYTDLTLSITDESLITPYGLSSCTMSVGLPETWTARYVGDYTYAGYFTGVDAGLTLYQSDIFPNSWKITHWGGDVDFCFTWNQESNQLVVKKQLIGNEHPSYGPVSVQSADYGVFENDVFHFYVQYVVDAGGFAPAEETFAITGKIKQ